MQREWAYFVISNGVVFIWVTIGGLWYEYWSSTDGGDMHWEVIILCAFLNAFQSICAVEVCKKYIKAKKYFFSTIRQNASQRAERMIKCQINFCYISLLGLSSKRRIDENVIGTFKTKPVIFSPSYIKLKVTLISKSLKSLERSIWNIDKMKHFRKYF